MSSVTPKLAAGIVAFWIFFYVACLTLGVSAHTKSIVVEGDSRLEFSSADLLSWGHALELLVGMMTFSVSGLPVVLQILVSMYTYFSLIVCIMFIRGI